MADVFGTDEADTLDAADGVTDFGDRIYGFGGADEIYGLGGRDLLDGGAEATIWTAGRTTTSSTTATRPPRSSFRW
jgi:hypothetical protein